MVSKADKTGINKGFSKSGSFVENQGGQGTKKGVNTPDIDATSSRASGSASLGKTHNKEWSSSSNPHLKNFDRLLEQTPGNDFRPEGAGAKQSRTDHNGNGISG